MEKSKKFQTTNQKLLSQSFLFDFKRSRSQASTTLQLRQSSNSTEDV